MAKQLRLGAQGLCSSCAFALRDLRLRCAPWIATPSEVRFCTERWGILDFLLSPPEPPWSLPCPSIFADGLTAAEAAHTEAYAAFCDACTPEVDEDLARAVYAATGLQICRGGSCSRVVDFDAVEDEDPTLEAAEATLESDGYSPRWSSNGGLYVPVGAGDDDALESIRQLLGDSYRCDWTGDGNTDSRGESTDDIRIEIA